MLEKKCNIKQQNGTKILCMFGNTVYYGHERSNIEVFDVLNDNGYKLKILCNNRGLHNTPQEVFTKKAMDYQLIRFPRWDDVRKPFKIIGFIRYFIDIFIHNCQFFKVYLKFRPNYVHVGNDFTYISLIPMFFLLNVKVVYRMGDVPLIHWKPFAFLWKRYIITRTHKFICISQYIKLKLQQIGRKPNNNDIIIYNYPPTRIVKDKTKSDLLKQGLTFTYLGQILEKKGVAHFINAALSICERYPNVYFLIAGDLNYDKVFSDIIISQVNESVHRNRFKFLGQLEELDGLFHSTDILITPSLKEEPLGNVIVEAKFYSTPSIIYKSGGMPELITHMQNGYICNESTPTSLYHAIEYYILNKSLIPEHGANAYHSIKELGIGRNEFVSKWKSVYS